MKTQTKETQEAMTPQEALRLLKAGNTRFQENLRANRNLSEQANITSNGQFPFAVIVSCIDSRTSAELIFDQGLGDIFSARVAGNVVNEDILGSLEFSCKLAGTRLLVVLGHSSCGAVKGACDGATLGNLTGLLQKIQPAVDAVRQSGELPRDQFVQQVAETNVNNAVQQIREKSPVLEEMIAGGQIGIVGAMHFLHSGEVRFQDLISGQSAQ